MKKEKWCPRRGIVFCSWDAEEYGLLGSTEWVSSLNKWSRKLNFPNLKVEENQKSLQTQAIAYLNVDSALSGNYTFQASATPILYETVWSATSVVTNPNSDEQKKGLQTIYDSYKVHRPSNFSGPLKPNIDLPGTGSDFSPFLQIVGIPVIDMIYDCNKTQIKCYPLYHTMYENYEMVSTFLDPKFAVRKHIFQVFPLIFFFFSISKVWLKSWPKSFVRCPTHHSFHTSIHLSITRVSSIRLPSISVPVKTSKHLSKIRFLLVSYHKYNANP